MQDEDEKEDEFVPDFMEEDEVCRPTLPCGRSFPSSPVRCHRCGGRVAAVHMRRVPPAPQSDFEPEKPKPAKKKKKAKKKVLPRGGDGADRAGVGARTGVGHAARAPRPPRAT